MKRFSWVRNFRQLLFLIAILVLACAVWTRVNASGNDGKVSLPNPQATTGNSVVVKPPTPAPPGYKPSEEKAVSTQHAVVITNRIDLAVNYQDKDKYVLLVHRADGPYVEFLVPVNLTGDDRKALLNLSSADVIVNRYPLIPQHPFPVVILPSKVSAQPTSIPQLIGYPPPATPTNHPYP